MRKIDFRRERIYWLQKAKNGYHWARSWYWVLASGYPAKGLKVIGVTGTDGKTTTCTIIYEILKAVGIKAGLITTVAAKIGDEEIDTGFHTTNPEARLLQGILVKMKEKGITHVVLEVTSHGLDQNRVAGCNFHIGVLTNLTHEHLDYHQTMERYRAAKARLFRQVKWAVINRDDPAADYFRRTARSAGAQVIEYGPTKLKDISPALAGEYNWYNIGAAEAVARILEADGAAARVVREFGGVPGRREEVRAGQKFRVVVDFAHTPNALKQVLTQLRRELPKGKKLIAVFGATGERDREKRPVMGRVASDLADVIVITSDDIRRENQDDIFAQIAGGIPAGRRDRIIQENDRRKAIETAVLKADPGDIVLLAGKGHEKTILIGTEDRPWSDMGEAKRAISSARL